MSFYSVLAGIESRLGQNTGTHRAQGLFQFMPGTFSRYSTGNIFSNQDQFVAVQRLTADNAAALTRAGLPVTGSNLYMLHQQGQAGGLALLQNPGSTPAELGLAGNVRGNAPLRGVDYVNEPASRFTGDWNNRWTAAEGRYGDSALPGVSNQNANIYDPYASSQVAGPGAAGYPNYDAGLSWQNPSQSYAMPDYENPDMPAVGSHETGGPGSINEIQGSYNMPGNEAGAWGSFDQSSGSTALGGVDAPEGGPSRYVEIPGQEPSGLNNYGFGELSGPLQGDMGQSGMGGLGVGTIKAPAGEGVQLPAGVGDWGAKPNIAPATGHGGSEFAGQASGNQMAGPGGGSSPSTGSGQAGGGGGGGGGQSWEKGGGVQVIKGMTKGLEEDTKKATESLKENTEKATKSLKENVEALNKTAEQTTTAINATSQQLAGAAKSVGSNWLVRGALIGVGLIFIAQGLSMFRATAGLVPNPRRIAERQVRKAGLT